MVLSRFRTSCEQRKGSAPDHLFQKAALEDREHIALHKGGQIHVWLWIMKIICQEKVEQVCF